MHIVENTELSIYLHCCAQAANMSCFSCQCDVETLAQFEELHCCMSCCFFMAVELCKYCNYMDIFPPHTDIMIIFTCANYT